jgi:hypothetical protein
VGRERVHPNKAQHGSQPETLWDPPGALLPYQDSAQPEARRRPLQPALINATIVMTYP